MYNSELNKLNTVLNILIKSENEYFISYLFNMHHHQSVLPKGRSFTASTGTKVAVLSKGRASTANSGTKVAVLLRINRCGSFPLLPATPLSL